MKPTVHTPVLLATSVSMMNVGARPGAWFCDATYGGGGHTDFIMSRGGRVLAIDRDMDAIERGRERHAREIADGKLRLVHARHGDLRAVAESEGISVFDGILMDLGISSDQLEPGKGFSFTHADPVDFRMCANDPLSGADILATWSEAELTRIFKDFGDEKNARQVARGLCRARAQSPDKLRNTASLAKLVESLAGGRRGLSKHPATRVFQSFMYATNDIVGELEKALAASLDLLSPGAGRLAILSYESVTDGTVKHTFLRHAGKRVSLQAGGSEWQGELPALEILTRHPVLPTEDEVRENPRSRSAKLRAARKLSGEETALLTQPARRAAP